MEKIIANIEEIQVLNRKIIMSGIDADVRNSEYGVSKADILRLRELAEELTPLGIFKFNLDEGDGEFLKSVKEFCSTF